MKALKCEMCDSNDIIKEDGYYVCQNCGTKYTVEEARKMMIEGTVDVSGTVKVDNSAELNNLYELAHRAKNDNNSENAEKYYSQIIIKDPSSWEANFYTTYYQSMNCKLGEVGVAAIRVSNCEETVFNLIKENITDTNEQRKAVDEIGSRLLIISSVLFNAYKNHFDGISSEIQGNYVQEYANNCAAARDIVYNGGDLIIKIFGDSYGDIAAACWKLGVQQHNILNGVFKDKETNANIIESYNTKIKKYDTSYVAPKTNMSQDGGCYIATAVYGSYDCPEVWTLRRFRDYDLAETRYGRAFIHMYYAISPTLVKCFGHMEWFKRLFRGKLDRMVKRLQDKGFESTPYEDRNW